jgi:1-aminocyclopropane-1-carboxylate deaminase/D-cysteine desulfhydrase-like pyridoxal-dependent ACC family enzyme
VTIVLRLFVPYDPIVEPAYQTLESAYPRFPLIALPSPLDRMERLEAALQAEAGVRVPRIYLKRDDLLPLGLGGNKLRNLEFLVGHAVAEGATDVVTTGRLQSNHCRLTAAACVRAGLRAHLIFTGRRPATRTANFLLDDLFGANVYFTGSDDRASRAPWIEMLMGATPEFGRRPYLIPVGGSDARGAMGHALAAQEIARQCDVLGEQPAAVVLATATGGTQAGMLAGLRRLGLGTRVYGLVVAKPAQELAGAVLSMANDVSAAIEGPPIASEDVLLDDAFLGGGYGVPSAAGQTAIEMLARAEGVLADPVYTGKALAGLLALVRGEAFSADDSVVFIHTGGAPALFADLPAAV